jgi:hypothetical protein
MTGLPSNWLELLLSTPTRFQEWYVNQDPRELIIYGNEPRFRSFVFWSYKVKVNILRSLYKMKRSLSHVVDVKGVLV